MAEVTDPELLKQLNAPEAGEVTDPELLKQLNAPEAASIPATPAPAPGFRAPWEYLHALDKPGLHTGEANFSSPSGVEALIRGLGNGLTLGHLTQPAAALAAAIPSLDPTAAGAGKNFSERYQHAKDVYEGLKQQSKEDYPISYGAGTVLGSVAPYSAAVKLGGALGAVTELPAAAVVGRIAGAGGAGAIQAQGEGGNPAIGAVGGAVGQGVLGEIGGAVANKAGTFLSKRALSSRLEGIAGSGIIQRIAKQTGASAREMESNVLGKSADLLNGRINLAGRKYIGIPPVKDAQTASDAVDFIGQRIGGIIQKADEKLGGIPFSDIKAVEDRVVADHSGSEMAKSALGAVHKEVGEVPAVIANYQDLSVLGQAAAANKGVVPFSVLHDWQHDIAKKVYLATGGIKGPENLGLNALLDFRRGVWNLAKDRIAEGMPGDAAKLEDLNKYYQIALPLYGSAAQKEIKELGTDKAASLVQNVLGPGLSRLGSLGAVLTGHPGWAVLKPAAAAADALNVARASSEAKPDLSKILNPQGFVPGKAPPYSNFIFPLSHTPTPGKLPPPSPIPKPPGLGGALGGNLGAVGSQGFAKGGQVRDQMKKYISQRLAKGGVIEGVKNAAQNVAEGVGNAGYEAFRGIPGFREGVAAARSVANGTDYAVELRNLQNYEKENPTPGQVELGSSVMGGPAYNWQDREGAIEEQARRLGTSFAGEGIKYPDETSTAARAFMRKQFGPEAEKMGLAAQNVRQGAPIVPPAEAAHAAQQFTERQFSPAEQAAAAPVGTEPKWPEPTHAEMMRHADLYTNKLFTPEEVQAASQVRAVKPEPELSPAEAQAHAARYLRYLENSRNPQNMATPAGEPLPQAMPRNVATPAYGPTPSTGRTLQPIQERLPSTLVTEPIYPATPEGREAAARAQSADILAGGPGEPPRVAMRPEQEQELANRARANEEIARQLAPNQGNYTVSSAPWGKDYLEIRVHDAEGRKIGSLVIDPHGPTNFPAMVSVDPAWQRQGLASTMYTHAENITGKPMAPSQLQTEQGQALWAQPTRPFGQPRTQPGEAAPEPTVAPDVLPAPPSKTGMYAYGGAVQPEPEGKVRSVVKDAIAKKADPETKSRNALTALRQQEPEEAFLLGQTDEKYRRLMGSYNPSKTEE